MKWFKSLFAWVEVRNTCIWSYRENTVTGDREARWLGGGYQPLNFTFMTNASGKSTAFGPHGRVTRFKH